VIDVEILGEMASVRSFAVFFLPFIKYVFHTFAASLASPVISFKNLLPQGLPGVESLRCLGYTLAVVATIGAASSWAFVFAYTAASVFGLRE
jgi:hypothetical protein